MAGVHSEAAAETMKGRIGGALSALAMLGVLGTSTGDAASMTLRECGRMSMPAGQKVWTYATPSYQCKRARLILHEWLYNGAHANLRGWRCFAGTQSGQIVTCRRGKNRLHMRVSGHSGAQIRVD